MAILDTSQLFRRFDLAEIPICQTLNRGCERPLVQGFFSVISRLGNGVFWYVLMATVPMGYGVRSIVPVLHMGLTSLFGVALYKSLKRNLARERPFVAHAGIRCGAPPLDRGSFPSGHTLHAVLFSVFILRYFPELAPVVLPFAGLVAISRVVLGLHYPTDVLAGGILGGILAGLSLTLLNPVS